MSFIAPWAKEVARHSVQIGAGLTGVVTRRALKSTVPAYETRSQQDWDKLHEQDHKEFHHLLQNNER